MPKYIVKNEQVLQEFLDNFWKAVGRRKGQKFVKALFQDPEIQGKMRQAQDIADDILDHIKEKDAKLARALKKKFGY
jgi:hypothetical protein